MTIYYWRGWVYRFWKGELASADEQIDEGFCSVYDRESSRDVWAYKGSWVEEEFRNSKDHAQTTL